MVRWPVHYQGRVVGAVRHVAYETTDIEDDQTGRQTIRGEWCPSDNEFQELLAQQGGRVSVEEGVLTVGDGEAWLVTKIQLPSRFPSS